MAKRKTEQTITVGNIEIAGRAADLTELADAMKEAYAAPVDLSDIEALEREAEQHAQPTPLIVRAMCAVVRELRLQRLGPGERRG